MGPVTPFAQHIHETKYRSSNESYREAINRVAAALKDDDGHYHVLRDILGSMRFMPGGRIQAAMGSTRAVTPYNCFVGTKIEDTFTDGDRSIMACAARGAITMRMGGGLGNDFSTLRPKGSLIRKLQSTSGGPVSFMPIFDSVGKATSSAGHRRGAQMGVMRVDHPDIEEFIHTKRDWCQVCEKGSLTGFNISVAVTDKFMDAVKHGSQFDLVFEGQTYKTIDARALWEMIMRSAWDWAEPGVLFIDRINTMNNLWYCETIAACNPCGEQPLPPDGACLLGSLNLVKYLVGSVGRSFDWDQFTADIPHVVRAMDNVVDRAIYPLYEQEKEAKSKRRMGLGITGLANALEALGYEYGSEEFLHMEAEILEALMIESYRASVELAKEKGPFPAFDAKQYLQSGFIQSHQELFEDEGIIEGIKQHGIRNSHLLSIAPTGTISVAADNVSSGIEPVFAYEADRTYIGPDNVERTVRVKDYGAEFLGVKGKRSSEVTAQEHVAVLTTAQRWVDSAVSKTCNVTGDMPWEDFKQIYFEAWERGAKGCTVFNADGERMAMLVEVDASCALDHESGRMQCE
jgi:ribonucleoside-diphosphate reductase alpha chain